MAAVRVCLAYYEVADVVFVLSMTEPLGCCFSSSFLSCKKKGWRMRIQSDQ